MEGFRYSQGNSWIFWSLKLLDEQDTLDLGKVIIICLKKIWHAFERLVFQHAFL